MLDIKYIRENSDKVKKAAQDKFVTVDVDRLLVVDEKIIAINQELDRLKEHRNNFSSKMLAASNDEKQKIIETVKKIKENININENELSPLKSEYLELMYAVPSVPYDEVPFGKTDDDNVEIKRIGEIPTFNFEIKDHVTLAEELDLVDIPRGVKVSGSRSYFLKNDALLLEMSISRYVIDKLIKKGFTPMSVPLMVKEEAMYGTSYFPGGRDQTYAITEDDLYLVGTSEVSLVSYNSGETFESTEALPKLYCGLSSCFRREAGTYGKDTRGLYRVHQFTKIEQVIMCEADYYKQYELHDFLLNNAEEILQDFKIPYRVVKVCTGDMGNGQVRKHDIEAWMPSRNKYSETHSCSSFNDFQARRSNIKYKDKDGSLKYCYTLNNTAIASPRILIPLLELYQNADGSITVPEVLVPYMNKTKIERKK
ncbi:MAG: serine--tRNA ligase [Clostridia bacterium]|nr:serine--tRNA ligase [Clostridia bacterium]MDD4387353.1 serine--tRNA ligase [Clostridia bacterium]